MCGRCRWCGRRCGGTCWTNAHRYNTYITLMNCDHFHLDGGLYLPFITGEELPLRSVRGGARLVWCDFGEIGDFGATARALSGESGVRHCMSLPAITKIKTKNRTIRNYFNLISTSTQEHKYGKRMGLMLFDVNSIKHQRKKKNESKHQVRMHRSQFNAYKRQTASRWLCCCSLLPCSGHFA